MNVMERLQKDIEKADPEYGQQMRDARSIVIDHTEVSRDRMSMILEVAQIAGWKFAYGRKNSKTVTLFFISL